MIVMAFKAIKCQHMYIQIHMRVETRVVLNSKVYIYIGTYLSMLVLILYYIYAYIDVKRSDRPR